MHFSFKFLSLIPLFTQTTLSTTYYGCWSDASSKFHTNCLVAASALIMAEAGNDYQDYLTSTTAFFGYGNCVVDIKGVDPPVYVDQAYLMNSINQLLSKCQDGWFFYDWGWVNFEARGHSGWTKRSIDPPPPRSLRSPSSKEEGIKMLRERQRLSKVTWNTTETIPYSSYNTTNNTNSTLAKRQPNPNQGGILGTFVFQIGDVTGVRDFWTLYRIGTIGTDQMPTDQNFFSDARENGVFNFWFGLLNTYADSIRSVPTEALINGHTNSITMSASLWTAYHANGWRNAIEGMTFNFAWNLALVAWDDWRLQNRQYALYNVRDRAGNIVWAFTYNAVLGTIAALPPSTP